MSQALTNKTLILTHPLSGKSEAFCQLFRDQGANVFHFPMIKTVPLDFSTGDIQNYNYIIFTSRNGVNYFFNDSQILEDVKQSKIQIISIGKQTSLALKELNLDVSFTPKKFNSDDLINELEHTYKLENQSILIVQGDLAPNKIQDALSRQNSVKRINVYQTIIGNSQKQEIDNLCSKQAIDYCIFTSPSAFIGFEAEYKSCFSNSTKIVSIGPITTNKINELGYQVDITAEESTYQGIYKSIIKNI